MNILQAYRIYICDSTGDIMDYSSFATEKECVEWAQAEWPKYWASKPCKILLTPDHGSYGRVMAALSSREAG